MASNKEIVVTVDVDETLVLWSKTHRKPGKGKKLFIDPYTKEKLYLTPHKVHMRLLKQYKARGFYVIVWSAAGQKWAEYITEKLGLEKYVDDKLAKPVKFMDDKDNLSDILGTRVYLKDS